jgi:hypothetical protein
MRADVRKKAVQKTILINLIEGNQVRCNNNNKIFIGFTKWQRTIIVKAQKSINVNTRKNDNLIFFHRKNERPRFTQAKVNTIQTKVINKNLMIKVNYKLIIVNDRLEKRRNQCESLSKENGQGRSNSRTPEKMKKSYFRTKRSKSYCIRRNKPSNRELYNVQMRVISLPGDIELNPGPNQNNNSIEKLRVMTYNIQGLGANAKLKRVNNILHKLDHRESYVINIQETHFKNEYTINYHWKWGVVQSLGTSNSCGVAILYSKSYFDEILETRQDKDGRFCAITAIKDGEYYSFLNISKKATETK